MTQGKPKLDLYAISQNTAKYDRLIRTKLDFFNQVCRWYSETFSTPLHIVREGTTVLWADVVDSYFQHFTHKHDYNTIFDDVYDELFHDEIKEKQILEDEKLVKEQEYQLQRKQLAKLLKTGPTDQKSQSYKGVNSNNASKSETQKEVIVDKKYDDTPPEDL